MRPVEAVRVTLAHSTSIYLSTLLVGSVLGLWAGYLLPGIAVFKGQSAAVLIPLAAFAVALAAWMILPRRRPAQGLVLAFSVVLTLAWLSNLISFRTHGDAFTYGALLFIPILAMISLKPPSTSEGTTVVVSFAWVVSCVLVATRLLEAIGVISPKHQPPIIIWFDETYYWLPLNEALGIDGRWPGPFGHNGYTAMAAGLVLVIAITFWTRSSWIFLIVGMFTLLVTSGRASAGAAAFGITLFVMFTTQGRLGRIPRIWRAAVGSTVLLAGAVVLLSGRSGLTGRQDIWPAFLDLWLTSPLTGVGTSGISESGGLTQEFGHAHSMYLDLLARNGVIAFAFVMSALIIGLAVCVRAAFQGHPGPLSLLGAYLVAAITEPRNDWLHPGTYVILLVVVVFTADASLQRQKQAPYSSQSIFK